MSICGSFGVGRALARWNSPRRAHERTAGRHRKLQHLRFSLAERHPFVTHSTLTLAPIGATLAKLEGGVECQGGIRLEVWELIDFAAHRIRTYSYEVYRAGEKVCWYDAWEHPEIPALAAMFPHHKHVPPNLRDNRVPAPGISFESPNLEVVLEDVRREWLQGV